MQIYYIFYGNWNTFSAGTAQFPTTFKVPTHRLCILEIDAGSPYA